MEGKHLIILVLTICCFSGSLLLSGPGDWFQSVKRKPFAAFLISMSIMATFLGSSTGLKLSLEVDTMRSLRIGVITSMAILAFIFWRKKGGAWGSLGWMAVYGLLAMCSATYSGYPLLSLYKGYEVATIVILGLFAGTFINTWVDAEDLVNIMLLVLWYLVISALVGMVVAPSEVMANNLLEDPTMAFQVGGVFPLINANSLTQMAGILAGCSLCRWLNELIGGNKMGGAAIFFGTTMVMILSHSRTSLVAFVVAVAFVLISYRKVGLALLSVVMVGLLASVSQFLETYFLRGQTAKQFTAMSGRIYFWPLVFRYAMKSPIIGYGFYASQRMLFGLATLDNTYMEVLLGMGIIGLTVFCLAVLWIALNLWRSRPPTLLRNKFTGHGFIWTELVVIFIFLFVRSLSGPSFEALHFNLTLFVLVTVCASAAYRLKKGAATGADGNDGRPDWRKAGMVSVRDYHFRKVRVG